MSHRAAGGGICYNGDMKTMCFLVAVLGLGGAWAAELPLEKTADGVRFGDARLAVAFDAKTGLPKSWTVDGAELLKADPETTVPLEVQEADGKWSGHRRAAYVGQGVARVGDNVVKSRVVNGPWTFDCYYELRSDKHMARRWFEIEWTDEKPSKFRGFQVDSGRLACATDAAGYLVPVAFPRIDCPRKSFSNGRRNGSWRSPFPILGDNGSGWSVSWMLDELVPYADGGSNEATQRADGFSVRTFFACKGHVRKGVPQKVGDVWTCFRPGTRETALGNMSAWFREVGQVPPADRPEWLKKLTLYSMHPGGTTGSLCRDWGGFAVATDYLPRLKELGCNAVWLMPLEDQSIYWPRDYYKLQEGIGSPDDYKAFVSRAHALGMKVWQDCVPHGGSNTNRRAKEHPEWLAYNEDGSTLTYWCFDFMWPTWIDYMAGVVGWYTKEYGLDGFRIDAVGGSHIPNWSEKIPYARASFAQSQGGLAMQRALRKAVKAVNPDSANLAEAGASIHGATSDATYDFTLCYGVLKAVARRPASEAVPQLRRWLHEQRLAEIPDLVRMRHTESHDSLRAALSYGVGASEAMMALVSWIPGIPLVYQEMEDASFDAFREIFRIRAAHDVLTLGDVDYLAPAVSDGVFACWRTLGASHAVPLVNFNGTNVACAVRLPAGAPRDGTWYDARTGASVTARDGVLRLALAGFGSTVLLDAPISGDPGVKAESTVSARHDSGAHRPPVREQSAAADLPRPELRLRDGGAVTQPYRLAAETNGASVVWRVASYGGLDPASVELVFRIPAATRWSAEAAEGSFGGPYRVRHPAFDGIDGPIYRFRQGGNELWNSRLHPFGFTPAQARVGASCGAAQWTFEPTGGARLLDRLDGARDLHVACAAPEAFRGRPLAVRVTRGAPAARPAGTGDPRLVAVAGGWQFDNGRIRLRIHRNGALDGYWRKEEDGTWTKLLDLKTLYTDIGYGDKRYSQEDEVETETAFMHDDTGRLVLAFKGHLRNSYRFAKMRQPVVYQTGYRLGDGDSFDLSEEVSATGTAKDNRAFLSFHANSPVRITHATFTDATGFHRSAKRGKDYRYLQVSVAKEHDAPPVRAQFFRADGKYVTFSDIDYGEHVPEAVFGGGDAFFIAWQECAGTPFPPLVKSSVRMTIR